MCGIGSIGIGEYICIGIGGNIDIDASLLVCNAFSSRSPHSVPDHRPLERAVNNIVGPYQRRHTDRVANSFINIASNETKMSSSESQLRSVETYHHNSEESKKSSSAESGFSSSNDCISAIGNANTSSHGGRRAVIKSRVAKVLKDDEDPPEACLTLGDDAVEVDTLPILPETDFSSG